MSAIADKDMLLVRFHGGSADFIIQLARQLRSPHALAGQGYALQVAGFPFDTIIQQHAIVTLGK